MNRFLLSATFCLVFTMLPFASETIAVLEFESNGMMNGEGQTVTNKFQNELMKLGAFTVIERSAMASILKEQGFQQSGCTSTECAVQIGMLLGAKYMIAGNFGKIGTLYSLTSRMVDVQTGKIIAFAESNSQDAIEQFFMIGVAENLRELLNNSNLKIKLPQVSASIIAKKISKKSKEFIPLTGRIKVPYSGVHLLESPTANGQGSKEIEVGTIYDIIGQEGRCWVVMLNGKKFYVTKSWSKFIE